MMFDIEFQPDQLSDVTRDAVLKLLLRKVGGSAYFQARELREARLGLSLMAVPSPSGAVSLSIEDSER